MQQDDATVQLQELLRLNHAENDFMLDPPRVATNHVTNDLVLMWKSGATSQQLKKWCALVFFFSPLSVCL